MKRTAILFFSLSLLVMQKSFSQDAVKKQVLTHADTLRGSITPERAWWDVLRYDISVNPDYANKSIVGSVAISFRPIKSGKVMQIDLQEPMVIDSVMHNKKNIAFKKADINVWYVTIDDIKPKPVQDKQHSPADIPAEVITIYYHGNPRIATRPPWNGGWIFTKDEQGRPWMSVACQGLGASVWYPCKDHQGDEPDRGASLTITVPDTLVAVGNGRLKEKKMNTDGTATYTWEVVNPINNYDIIPYIGKYVTWHKDFIGEKGKLDCDFWVLDYDLEKAKEQFKQADSMLRCFEYWMGPYPFYEDGYKLVAAPHLGMEHQSAVAYGNKYANGYLGKDLSATGWGLKWDFIIVHESGHEWFGNNITSKDVADMWVHEGFTNYTETLYTSCQDGVQAGNEYCIGTRKKIRNDRPIIGQYGVNKEGSGDMYYKGGNLLHTIRQAIHDDEKFRQILHGLNKKFYHQTVTSAQVEHYISEQAKIDFSKVFDQYLRTTKIPVLEYKTTATAISFRWTNCVKGFNLPLKVDIGSEEWISPTEQWKTLKPANGYDGKTFTADPNFYIEVKQL
jgi:aminopeptidase N